MQKPKSLWYAVQIAIHQNTERKHNKAAIAVLFAKRADVIKCIGVLVIPFSGSRLGDYTT